MKDGQTLTIDGSSLFSFSQTITNRATSTYSNVLTINETVQKVAGTYTCTVSNDLGFDSMEVVAIGEFGSEICILVSLTSVLFCMCVFIMHVGRSVCLSVCLFVCFFLSVCVMSVSLKLFS